MSHIASVHEKKKPHQCTDCDQTYAKKDNLKVHMAAIHEGLYRGCVFFCHWKVSSLEENVGLLFTQQG